jgi:hypothetical protein
MLYTFKLHETNELRYSDSQLHCFNFKTLIVMQ